MSSRDTGFFATICLIHWCLGVAAFILSIFDLRLAIFGLGCWLIAALSLSECARVNDN